MIQDLADQIWANPDFHKAASEVELRWLQFDLGAAKRADVGQHASKLMRAAAILACSDRPDHKRAAFRIATSLYELFGSESLPMDQALRVVLARLGNFPAFSTRPDLSTALSRLPTAMAIEEISSGDGRSVRINGEIVFLTDFQYRLWGSLQRKDRVALAAPTSAGKSFVLEGYLASLFEANGPRTIIYLVPTRALIAQVSDDLLKQFRALGDDAPAVVTVPLDGETVLPDRAVYVMTQERVQIMAATHSNFAANLVIVDEAHAIAEDSRGVLLQWVIDDLLTRNPAAQILFASPNVRNLEIFSQLFGLSDVTLFSSAEPTVAQNFLITRVESAASGKIVVSTVGDGSRVPVQVAEFSLDRTIASRTEKLVHIAAVLGRGHSNIIYANGAAEAEKVALQIAEFYADREQTPARLALSQLASEAVHANYALVECAKVGVAFHYSNIPTHLRMAIESAVSSGDVDFLVCTSTLLQGVNLPAKNIFMFAPEKGRLRPLESTDFWNLSGRAGRLRREFQGNIFLIDYDAWKKKPLDGPRDTVIMPAIEANIREQGDQLIGVIRDDPALGRADKANLESTFVRLFSDHEAGRLDATLNRIGIPGDAVVAKQLAEALVAASETVILPSRVLRNTPNISAHKQQRLYDEIRSQVAEGKDAARGMIPRHPRETGAFDSYAEILERCHRIILGIDTMKNLHRFHALLAVWWMEGLPLPVIVQNQIDKNPAVATQTSIRKTLELIETQIRFQAVRLVGCYISLLVYALDQEGLPDLASSIPSIPVFLEIGASDKTMISFISLGLSRVAAAKLNEMALRKDMDEQAALTWLKTRPLEALGLSPLLLTEVEAIISRSLAA